MPGDVPRTVIQSCAQKAQLTGLGDKVLACLKTFIKQAGGDAALEDLKLCISMEIEHEDHRSVVFVLPIGAFPRNGDVLATEGFVMLLCSAGCQDVPYDQLVGSELTFLYDELVQQEFLPESEPDPLRILKPYNEGVDTGELSIRDGHGIVCMAVADDAIAVTVWAVRTKWLAWDILRFLAYWDDTEPGLLCRSSRFVAQDVADESRPFDAEECDWMDLGKAAASKATRSRPTSGATLPAANNHIRLECVWTFRWVIRKPKDQEGSKLV